MKKTLKKANLKLGKWEYEIELRTDPMDLAKKLNIELEIAVKLSAMEVLSDRQSKNETTFKNWKNKRIYFTNSADSNNANSQQRYWDIENNRLIDNGLSHLELRNMTEALSQVTVDTFYGEERK